MFCLFDFGENLDLRKDRVRRANVWIPMREGGWDGLGGWNWHIYRTIYKIDN